MNCPIIFFMCIIKAHQKNTSVWWAWLGKTFHSFSLFTSCRLLWIRTPYAQLLKPSHPSCIPHGPIPEMHLEASANVEKSSVNSFLFASRCSWRYWSWTLKLSMAWVLVTWGNCLVLLGLVFSTGANKEGLLQIPSIKQFCLPFNEAVFFCLYVVL